MAAAKEGNVNKSGCAATCSDDIGTSLEIQSTTGGHEAAAGVQLPIIACLPATEPIMLAPGALYSMLVVGSTKIYAKAEFRNTRSAKDDPAASIGLAKTFPLLPAAP